MPRCPDCNKFVALDVDQDPDAEVALDGEGRSFTVSVTRTLGCGECGTDLKVGNFEVELHVPDEYPPCDFEEGQHDWEGGDVEVLNIENTEEFVGKSKFQKRMLGVQGEIRAVCGVCESELILPFKDELQVSHYDDA